MIKTEDVIRVLVDKYGEENEQLFVDYIRRRITKTELNRSLINSLLRHKPPLQHVRS